MATDKGHFMDRVVRKSLDGGIPLFLFIVAVVSHLA